MAVRTTFISSCSSLGLRAVHDVPLVGVGGDGHVAVEEVGVVVEGVGAVHQVVVDVRVDEAACLVLGLRDAVADGRTGSCDERILYKLIYKISMLMHQLLVHIPP